MKSYLTGWMLVILSLLPTTAPAHTELAAQIILENFDNELYVKAILDKRMLAVALMHEGTCTPQEMLPVCGNAYYLAHFELTVNCETVSLEMLSMEIQKNAVIFSYQAKKDQSRIQTVGMKSDYMRTYNTHAVVRTQISIYNDNKSFDLDQDRSYIETSLKPA